VEDEMLGQTVQPTNGVQQQRIFFFFLGGGFKKQIKTVIYVSS
jgi:hypothetical protein